MTVHVRTVSLLLLTLLLLPLLPPPAPAEPGPREPGVFEFNIYLKAPGDPWHQDVHHAFYELTRYGCELPNVIEFQRIDEGSRWRYRCIFNSRDLTRYVGTAISSLTYVDVRLQQNTNYRYDFVINKQEQRSFMIGSYSSYHTYANLTFVFPAYETGTPQYTQKQVKIVRVDVGYEYDFAASLTIERVTQNHLRITLQRHETNPVWVDYIYVVIGTHRLITIDFYDVSSSGARFRDTYLTYERFNRLTINIYLQS